MQAPPFGAVPPNPLAEHNRRLEHLLRELRRAMYAKKSEKLQPDQLQLAFEALEGALAHVLVSKFADHLPLYRQSQILARSGIDVHRSTLADWVGKTAFHQRTLVRAMPGGRVEDVAEPGSG